MQILYLGDVRKTLKNTKIGFFHCSFVYSGGGERIALEGVLGLRKRGYEVDLYSPAIDPRNCYPDLLKEAGPKPILFRFSSWIPFHHAIDMGLSSLLAPLVSFKFAKYDVFIGENQPGVWFAWVYSKIFGKPYIIYLNQPNRLIYPRKIDIETGWSTNKSFELLEKIIVLFKPFVAYLDRISIRGASSMTVNGRFIGGVISKIYKKKFVECPAGCDPFFHGKLKFSKDKFFRGKIKVAERIIQKPYILLTNRHYPQKRFDLAIMAMGDVVKKFPGVKLVITGDFTSSTREWRKLAVRMKVAGNVVWLGEVNDFEMAKLYENAAVYVYTSPQEDYGMGVVEAQEFGVPVVAWNQAGPTVTIVNGKTGFLASPLNVSEFSDKIIWLLSHHEERVKMGKAAHGHVRKKFTWKRHVDILEKEFKGAIKNR